MELGFEFKPAKTWSEAFGINSERAKELAKQMKEYLNNLASPEEGFTMSKAVEDLVKMGKDNRESLWLVLMFGKLMGRIESEMEGEGDEAES